MSSSGNRLLDTLERLSDALVLDNLREGAGARNTLIALEVMASLHRRAAIDVGVPKEAMEQARRDASEIAGLIYNDSNLSASAKALREQVAMNKKDDADPRGWADAGRIAKEAIRKATGEGNG